MAKRIALLSVYDKTGLESFAHSLHDLGFTFISTGGTAEAIRDVGLEVIDVSELTGVPEGLGGRVKSLHPVIQAGILADPDEPGDQEYLTTINAEAIALVVCNFYPFAAKPSIETIDIGGPTMVRAAAKNHACVGVVTSPSQYDAVVGELRTFTGLTQTTKHELAVQAFEYTANYERLIAQWFRKNT